MELTDDQKRFMEQHDLLSALMNYPPFSSMPKKRRQLVEMITGEEWDGVQTGEEVVRSAIARQDEAMKAFEVEFEEASLWMARYPLDPSEATAFALRLDGVSEDDIEVHLSSR